MEDDEEIHSQQSDGDSGSPSDLSPPSNGRITVTVASAPPSMSPPHPNLKALTLALPTQQKQSTKNSGGGGGSGREDCWSEEATEVLIEAWGERYLELSRGNLKQKHWKEVAEIVNSSDDYSKIPKTDIQCKNRIDTVKKKYKSEKAKIATGAAPSKWVFYKRMDQLIGPTGKGAINSAGGKGGGSGTKVPIGISVGFRSAMNQFRGNPIPEPSQQKHPQSKRTAVLKSKNQIQKVQTRKRGRAEPESEEEDDNEMSEESMESLPPPPEKRTKKVQQKEVNSGGEVENWGNSVKELTQVILKFGEA